MWRRRGTACGRRPRKPSATSTRWWTWPASRWLLRAAGPRVCAFEKDSASRCDADRGDELRRAASAKEAALRPLSCVRSCMPWRTIACRPAGSARGPAALTRHPARRMEGADAARRNAERDGLQTGFVRRYERVQSARPRALRRRRPPGAAARHIMRPALANERVQCDTAGLLVPKLETPRRDDTPHLGMSPPAFMRLRIGLPVCSSGIQWCYVSRRSMAGGQGVG